MRLACYNTENLFSRAKAMNGDTLEEGREALEAFAALSALLGEVNYTEARKRRMLALLSKLGLERSDEGPFVRLRQNRGALVRRPRNGAVQIVADGRADWVGGLELITEPVNENAMRNTARVMTDVGADILGVVEAESRPALRDFNAVIVGATGGTPYRHVMLIDGNDRRGIDVGLLTREGFAIGDMRSHVDDPLSNGSQFSRDCPAFEVTTPSGKRLTVLVNHFKSKANGTQAANNAKRRAEAERVREIYDGFLENGRKLVAVVGDLNDTPDSSPLEPLLSGTGPTDIFEHPLFEDGGHPGTYGLCNANQKIDYILLSPDLFALVQAGGVFRKGMWPGVRPVRWEAYTEVDRPDAAASDHAALWVDLDV